MRIISDGVLEEVRVLGKAINSSVVGNCTGGIVRIISDGVMEERPKY